MHISQLSLTNYRNYSRLTLDLPRGPILLRGDNANGKTNLLESIYFLSTTRSSHARTDQQLINWLVFRQETLPFTRIEATVQTDAESFQLAITVLRENDSMRKDIRLNGAKKRAMDIIGKLNTVMFLPEDIELVTGAPAVRRRALRSGEGDGCPKGNICRTGAACGRRTGGRSHRPGGAPAPRRASP